MPDFQISAADQRQTKRKRRLLWAGGGVAGLCVVLGLVFLLPALPRLAITLDIATEGDTMADPIQLEQAVINLIRNAADAAQETRGREEVALAETGDETVITITITITDDGPCLPRTETLFVPGFTTKPGGSGIGLVLAREIIEAHGGRLRLTNRDGQQGAVAQVQLPHRIGG
jgi:signal transduction histidine kinase